MLRKKSFWISIVIILLAIGGGGYYYANAYLPSQTPEETEQLQTAKVRRGDLSVSAGGAGVVISAQEADIGFRSGGVLLEMNVRPGSAVAAGDVLARLDDADARGQLAQAEANLRLAQLKLQQSDTSVSQAEDNLQIAQLKLNQSDSTIAQAEATLNLAQLKLQSLLSPADDATLAVAQANLISAQSDLNDLLVGPTAENLAIAEADLEQSAIAVQQAQTAYDKVAWGDDAGISPQAASLQTATLNYQKALASYQQKTTAATPAQIAAAQSKVIQAQQQYDALIIGADDETIAAAELAVAQAQANLETVSDTTALEIAVKQAQAAIETAQDTTALEIAVEQAQLAVDSAQRNLDAFTLRAPFAGTVVKAEAIAGEAVGTAPIITLVDLSHSQVEIYLDETDMDKLAPGNKITAEFDALPELVFPGEVSQINPLLITIDGVPAISAVAELSPASENPTGQLSRLIPGMNAAVEIIAGQAQDALLVPVESLRELGPEQYAVFVMIDGTPTLRPVEVGLMDFSFAEIISGLEQGETVTTGTIATE